MTTPQIYSLFAMLTAAAIAGIVFYCVGLRAGKAAGLWQGREKAMEYFKGAVADLSADLTEARDLLDIRTRDTASLRESMQHIERDLLQRLAAAAPLSEEDHAVLLAVADKLLLAGSTFAGLGSNEHARTSSHLMAQVLDIADRIKKALSDTRPHPDSELIEWLATIAEMDGRPGEGNVELPPMPHPHPNATMRETIRHYQAWIERAENEECGEGQEDAA